MIGEGSESRNLYESGVGVKVAENGKTDSSNVTCRERIILPEDVSRQR